MATLEGSTIDAHPVKRRSIWLLAAIVAGVVLVGTILAVFLGWLSPAGGVEQAYLGGQGGDGVWANDAVTLERRADGLVVTLSAPRPDPGSYSYPPAETPAGEPTLLFCINRSYFSCDVRTYWNIFFPFLLTDGNNFVCL